MIPSIESDICHARELLHARQFADCLRVTEALAFQLPKNPEILHLLAISQRYLNRVPDALATLARLERSYPSFGRLYEERGHCYMALTDTPRAIEAFLTAVNINPALPVSWSMLQGLYGAVGSGENAAMAAAHVATLKRLPPEVVQATSLFSDGDLSAAESMVRAYLLKHGDHIEAMRLLARIGMALDVLDDAELLLEAVLKIAPTYSAARYDFAQVLLRRHKHLRASEELKALLEVDHSNREYLTSYATACAGLGEHEKAVTLYRRLLIDVPRAADLQLSVAHSLKTMGRREEAIEAYRASAAARPAFGDAYWSLANLKTYRFTDGEIERMRAAEGAESTPLIDRYHLCFALGKAFEDRGDYETSYRYYEHGNELKRSEIRYRPEHVETNTRKQIAVCTKEFFARRVGVGNMSAEPIFIVGLPRSGSTLLEQILASHSRVEGTHELLVIPRMVLGLQDRIPDLANPRYPGILAELQPADFLRLGEKYLHDTRGYRTNRARFIDKMPNNFRHIGLIHLMLPNARIIDARREPMACCFSNLKQLFASGQEFTYSVQDIARYYRAYLDLMRHWDTVLPGRILRIWHEDVVDDLASSVRRILEFCGLDFEPACVEFYRTERSVRTASSEQVRQPIFREGLRHWKHYEPWLGDLKDALGDALIRYRE